MMCGKCCGRDWPVPADPEERRRISALSLPEVGTPVKKWYRNGFIAKKNGKCIFAIGDKDIAPIDYFDRYDSAVTVTSYDQIEEKLKELIFASEKISEYGKKAYECGKAHHEKSQMDALLRETIIAACRGKV